VQIGAEKLCDEVAVGSDISGVSGNRQSNRKRKERENVHVFKGRDEDVAKRDDLC
jgi:hypothetical protein